MKTRRESDLASRLCSELGVVAPDTQVAVRALSGGNQQKVVIGKWIAHDARVLILDEPTRGVDVGAKLEIYRLIRRFADEGGAVLVISSEMPEILGLCDRIK